MPVTRPPIRSALLSALRYPLSPVYSGAGALAPIAGMALWLRKSTASGATWPDASGNARDMTLTGSPTIGATSVTFNGTSQYGTIATTGAGTAFTVYLRFKQVAWTSGRVIFTDTSGGPYFYQATSTPRIAYNDLYGDGQLAGNDSATIGSFVSAAFRQSSSNVSINIGGTTTTSGGGGGYGLTSFRLGANSAAAQFSNIEVVEAVLYDAAHTAPEQAQMLAYLDTL